MHGLFDSWYPVLLLSSTAVLRSMTNLQVVAPAALVPWLRSFLTPFWLFILIHCKPMLGCLINFKVPSLTDLSSL
ncbi:hypothetical protein BDW74DRAFT_150684 [Aspergillus multicolor]|uniref:uncharacterized protein n=1 Tax=Aspergillus multicolor TaxID=41759 RepID=UPI003CCE1A11